MSPDKSGSRIADDYASIAARVRELDPQSRHITTRHECAVCNGRGWVWSTYVHDWRGCPRCGMSEYCPKPPLRR